MIGTGISTNSFSVMTAKELVKKCLAFFVIAALDPAFQGHSRMFLSVYLNSRVKPGYDNMRVVDFFTSSKAEIRVKIGIWPAETPLPADAGTTPDLWRLV